MGLNDLLKVPDFFPCQKMVYVVGLHALVFMISVICVLHFWGFLFLGSFIRNNRLLLRMLGWSVETLNRFLCLKAWETLFLSILFLLRFN
jgi:hypothetical protein